MTAQMMEYYLNMEHWIRVQLKQILKCPPDQLDKAIQEELFAIKKGERQT